MTHSVLRLVSLVTFFSYTSLLCRGESQLWVEYPAAHGPGEGRHVVFLTGDEEYRSEEGLPMLAKILSQRHGFRCTVLFAVDPKTGEIDPNNRRSLPGAESLDSADAIVMLVRRREWPEKAMFHFIKAYEAGKPIIALRTSTHAFHFPQNSRFHEFNQFGEKVLGEEWVSHWGRHKEEATRGILEPAASGLAILNGVSDIFGDTDVYEAYPPEDAQILLRGQVLAGTNPHSPPARYSKKRATDGRTQAVNDPMMPIAWTRLHKNSTGKTNRVFCTTMGSATDLRSEGLRRLIVNAVYWGLEMDVPKQADVDYVGEYEPSAYGFDGFRQGMRPADFALGSRTTSSVFPFRFTPHERIALVGNSLAERMNLFGHFEALLHLRFPTHELAVRNFARPADAVNNRQRPNNYTEIDDPLSVFNPDTFLCFFGFNESFAGAEAENQFRTAYGEYLDEITSKYPRKDGSAPRFVLISPIAWEPTGNPLWPDDRERNQNLRRYAQIVAKVARERGLVFVDLFTPTEALFSATPGMQYTINGCHLNEAGDREVALLLERALFGDSTSANLESELFQQLRAAVQDKSWIHLQDYRMLNGWYVYGGRRTWDTETFPREFKKIRAMVALRDRYVWHIAQGKTPTPPDDNTTGELFVPPTRFGNPQQDYSEPEELRYLSPEDCIATMKVPEGFAVQLYASEREFPELAKPNQLNFDNRGRLWVSCMPTYPQWKPGDPRPSDRLLIFEDDDHDGRADRCKVFYNKLHCPTGFEFWNGGVLVVDQPRLIWLKDTDGDDRADVVVHLFDGWATDDTHHTIGAFEYSHGGLLHMLEGISMSTTVETPWGPHRNKDTGGAHILDPRTLKLTHFVTPGYGNPWCYVFDSWGRGIVGDGTTAQQHWDSPLSGAAVPARRGIDPIFDTQGMRPVVGSEFLFSRHMPPQLQGQFIYACVINMNGMPRFTLYDESAGMRGHRVLRPSAVNGGEIPQPDDLLASSDKNFRPVDPQIGPDGTLWFGDWCNALIGHMQYSQRDPNRDHVHGRIYRLVNTRAPLLEPVTQYDKSEVELLQQLREYEPRTRYRARRELRDRPTPAVVAAVKAWLASLDPAEAEFDRLRCEALWVLQGHHAVDLDLLRGVLGATTPDARAAATHLVADEREYLPNALELLVRQVGDEHPRVRLEAVRGLSFFRTTDAVNAALEALDSPLDSWIEYTLEHTLAALEPVWLDAFLSRKLVINNERAAEYLAQLVARRQPSLLAGSHLKTVLNPDASDSARTRGYAALELLRGNHANGQAVFRRVCSSCHRTSDVGFTFGPELSDVGKRLTRRELIESIIEPSKKVDPKYVTTTVITMDGRVESGLVSARTDKSLTLLMAEGKQKSISLEEIDEIEETNQSSMPENLAATLAPAEFLDLIEYLTTLK